MQKTANRKAWKLNLEFKYTVNPTPQRYHPAEAILSTILGIGRAMTRNPKFSLKTRYKVCKEALKTSTLMYGLTVVTCDWKKATKYDHWMGNVPKFASKSRTWGKLGVIK